MRIVMISLAAAASTLAIATPAAAQYYPQPQPRAQAFGYGQQNWGHVRNLQVRIDRLQHRIARLDGRDRISEREARRLRDEARELERRFRWAARNGLHPVEAQRIEIRLARLEQRLVRDAHDGNRWGQNHNNQGYSDRDRDGRPDRWEDDRGRDRDD